MRFFDPPVPASVDGWLAYNALYRDNFQFLQCEHRLPLGKDGRLRKCKNGARFRRVEDDRVLCLQHYRKETS